MSLVERYCCKIGCDRDAEYEIIGGSGHFEDVTDACPPHVGHLLGTPTWLESENRQWTVVLIV